jgi:hypothetical protein
MESIAVHKVMAWACLAITQTVRPHRGRKINSPNEKHIEIVVAAGGTKGAPPGGAIARSR